MTLLKLKETFKVYFVGVGQIMLQENAITGLLFTIGVLFNSIVMGCLLLLASILGTELAKRFKYNNNNINKGLYGFNTALVGVAVVVFLKLSLLTFIILIVALVLTTLLQHFFIKYNLSVFTLPFVVVTYLILIFCSKYFSHLIQTETELSVTNTLDLLFVFKGFGQVIFQNSILSGLIFFLAVFVSSPVAALYGLVASAFAAGIFYLSSVPITEINIGLFSFNAVLCAITFSGKQLKNSLLIILSVLLSIIISLFLYKFQILQLTLPFVVSCSVLTFLIDRKKNV